MLLLVYSGKHFSPDLNPIQHLWDELERIAGQILWKAEEWRLL